MIGFVDAHCHLGQYADPLATLRQASARGVVTVAVTESPEEYRRLRTRLGKAVGVRLALGAHPLKASRVVNELPRFQRLLADTDWVGEIGLDYSPQGAASRAVQRRVFEQILLMPSLRQKVVSVHSRGAERDTVALLEDAGVRGVLHWWSGPTGMVQPAAAAGLWFSVNAHMLRSKKGLASLAEMPRDRVTTETDGPYTRMGGPVATPADVPRVVESLARAWDVHTADAQAQVWQNMASLYSVTAPRPASDEGDRASTVGRQI